MTKIINKLPLLLVQKKQGKRMHYKQIKGQKTLKLQQNTQNKQQKIDNLEMIIRELEVITSSKRDAFLAIIQKLRLQPKEQSYIELKNLFQSLQPVLCTIVAKVPIFQEDCVVRNDPQFTFFQSVKNDIVGELQQSTKLQIQQIDQKGIQCKYSEYNRQLAKQIYHINKSVESCVDYLLDKFQTFTTESEKIRQGHQQTNNNI